MARNRFAISVICYGEDKELVQRQLMSLTDHLICSLRELDEEADVVSESTELDSSSEFVVDMDPLK